MLTLVSEMTVAGITAREITDFMLECDDARYQAWWPGTHRSFHVVEPGPGPGHVGDRVWMDELVGDRHLRMAAEVEAARPGDRIVWRFLSWRLRVPVRLTLAVADCDDGVRVRHALTAGWVGWRRVLDPLWRLYFTRSFAVALDRHARTEFPRLAPLLHPGEGRTR